MASNAAAVVSDVPGGSPSTGAMDSLLEKLRAAAPQTRDTRDRRRRARLKDKHQVRVASGQQIPETGENVEGEETVDENGLLTPAKTDDGAGSGEGGVSEGEDIADRAASLLQGLRGDGEVSEVPSRDESGSLRIRRRRESADDERARRRARRRGAGTGSQDAGTQQSTIAEEGEGDSTVVMSSAQAEDVMSNGSQGDVEEVAALPVPPTPTTVVVPPSPTGSVHGDDDAENEKEDGKDQSGEIGEEKEEKEEGES